MPRDIAVYVADMIGDDWSLKNQDEAVESIVSNAKESITAEDLVNSTKNSVNRTVFNRLVEEYPDAIIRLNEDNKLRDSFLLRVNEEGYNCLIDDVVRNSELLNLPCDETLMDDLIANSYISAVVSYAEKFPDAKKINNETIEENLKSGNLATYELLNNIDKLESVKKDDDLFENVVETGGYGSCIDELAKFDNIDSKKVDILLNGRGIYYGGKIRKDIMFVNNENFSSVMTNEQIDRLASMIVDGSSNSWMLDDVHLNKEFMDKLSHDVINKMVEAKNESEDDRLNLKDYSRPRINVDNDSLKKLVENEIWPIPLNTEDVRIDDYSFLEELSKTKKAAVITADILHLLSDGSHGGCINQQFVDKFVENNVLDANIRNELRGDVSDGVREKMDLFVDSGYNAGVLLRKFPEIRKDRAIDYYKKKEDVMALGLFGAITNSEALKMFIKKGEFESIIDIVKLRNDEEQFKPDSELFKAIVENSTPDYAISKMNYFTGIDMYECSGLARYLSLDSMFENIDVFNDKTKSSLVEINNSGLLKILGESDIGVAGYIFENSDDGVEITLGKKIETIKAVAETDFYQVANSPAFGRMKDSVIKIIYRAENILEFAESAVKIATKEHSQAEIATFITELLMLTEKEGFHDGALSNHYVEFIPLSAGFSKLDQSNRGSLARESRGVSSEDILSNEGMFNEYVDSQNGLDQFISEYGGKLPFNKLKEEYRKLIFLSKISSIISYSTDKNLMNRASELNRESASETLELNENELIHATSSVSSAGLILETGIICGESIGRDASADSYPLNADFVEISQNIAEEFKSKPDSIPDIGNERYGDVCFVVSQDKERNFMDYGNVTDGGMRDNHRLVLGGVPSVDIIKIFLRSSSSESAKLQAEQLSKMLANKGVYIPVYGPDRKIMFTYEDFVETRNDLNCDSVEYEEVEKYRYNKDKTQGSNDGGWYVIGGEEYYAKLSDGSLEKNNHIQAEYISDCIYKEFDSSLASETKIMKLEGRLTRLSKMIDVDDGRKASKQERNAGFVMDCLLGNWDAVYNDANLIVDTNGNAIRIDNGNTLMWRARGDRKDASGGGVEFDGKVREIEFGDNRNLLGLGMRQEYDISNEEIISQIDRMSEKITDNFIEKIVNSTRLPSDDREHIIKTLRERRDYLVNYKKNIEPTQ